MRTPRRRTTLPSLAAAVALILAACGEESGGEDPPEEATSEQATTEEPADESPTDDGEDQGTDAGTGGADESSPTGDSAGGGGESTDVALDAIATAEDEAGGQAYAIDDPDEDGTWEVDVAVDGRSVEVQVSSGGDEVRRTEEDDLDGEDRRALQEAEITLAEAIERAVAEAGGVLGDAELDEDDGRAFWSVSLDLPDRGDVEYRVDTASGEVSQDRDEDD